MGVTATQVKELRQRTGAGMMDCKHALAETGGDTDAAVERLRVAGLARADRKSGREATEGGIYVSAAADGKASALLELNCETDFVARNEFYTGFGNQLAVQVLAQRPATTAALLASSLPDGSTVDETRRSLVARLGENINIRRCCVVESTVAGSIVGGYVHGGRIGVLVELEGPEALARDIAMHVTWANPSWVSPDQVPADYIEQEQKVLMAQAEQSGKPAAIIEKMVAGRLAKELRAVTLLGQGFVRSPDLQVSGVLAEANARVLRFVRYEVGAELTT